MRNDERSMSVAWDPGLEQATINIRGVERHRDAYSIMAFALDTLVMAEGWGSVHVQPSGDKEGIARQGPDQGPDHAPVRNGKPGVRLTLVEATGLAVGVRQLVKYKMSHGAIELLGGKWVAPTKRPLLQLCPPLEGDS